MEFLKALFESGADGKLSFDELKALCAEKEIKIADLSKGNYVSKAKFNDEISARDTRITDLESTIGQRDTDIADFKSQLEQAGADKTKLSELTNQLTGLQKKYDDDTKALQEKVLSQRRDYAVRDYANSKKFTSQAAKRDFERYLMSKEFSLSDDGTLMGGDDFVTEYSKENADAFVVEDKSPKEPLPQFVGPTPGSDDGKKEASFPFSFIGVRPHD